jgi:hypothetical protein
LPKGEEPLYFVFAVALTFEKSTEIFSKTGKFSAIKNRVSKNHVNDTIHHKLTSQLPR